MGVQLEMKIISQGYFPDMIGRVDALIKSLKPGEKLKPITLTEKKNQLTKIRVLVNVVKGELSDYFEQKFKSEFVIELKKTHDISEDLIVWELVNIDTPRKTK